MKEMRRDDDLYREKIAEMVGVYRKVAGECWSQQQALEMVVSHPASKYFIQAHSAYNVLRKLASGGMLPIHKDCERRMYTRLWERVCELSTMPEHAGKGLHYLCEIAVGEPAPEFYMKATSFRHILRMEKERMVREKAARRR